VALLRRTCGTSSIEQMKVFCTTCCTSCHPIFSGAPGCCSWLGEVSRFSTDCTSSTASASSHRASMPTQSHSSCAARLGILSLIQYCRVRCVVVVCNSLSIAKLGNGMLYGNSGDSSAGLRIGLTTRSLFRTSIQVGFSEPLANARASRTRILQHFKLLPGCLKQMSGNSLNPGKAGESASVWRSAQSTGSGPVLNVSQRVVGSVQQLFLPQ